MEDVAKNVMFNLHPNYKLIHQKIYVCITNLPVYDQIRNIRQIHLNTMIRIGGVVTRRTGVFPQLQQVKRVGQRLLLRQIIKTLGGFS
uniref:DNA replication licensing factor MCM2-like isoform X4 n=1 Tax=Fragaria vesca subsp. vesca TaxID=101020 RepID=UPI0005CB2776|nr:PREDICTED: DNA replication licensing factor MCM2-like isoform X4 [Fragaria vesca subsp. vesca]